ncbi:unnamed protein product [Schistosoma margrebowiei]|uniref:Probable RNA-binding protein EIF1AD n=1 Tax=Schistosoma margrebowiei TaxID=48269 RepID=A0A183MJ42_9TREM|nr:unnamed protein product [Schistosoma margrebowiei]
MILPSSVPKRKKAEKELFKDTHTIESNEIICKGEEVFVSIPERFRNTFYFAQGGFVICSPLDSKKVKGEIRTVLQKDNIKALINEGRWPETFTVNISKESSIKNDNYIPEDMLPSLSDSSDTESECISDNN